MNVEIMAVADFARVYAGKSVINGPFDHVIASKVPAAQSCALALRIRFSKSEEGKHPFKLQFIDADGNLVMPEMTGMMDVRVPPGLASVAVDLAIGIPVLRLPEYTEYAFVLVLDNREASRVPVTVIPGPQQKGKKEDEQKS